MRPPRAAPARPPTSAAGTRPWAGAGRAGLTRRYFYESFEDLDALLGALFERVTQEVRAAVLAVASEPGLPLARTTRTVVSCGLDVLPASPAKGRFLAGIQAVGGPVAERRAKAVEELAAIVEQQLTPQAPAPHTEKSGEAAARARQAKAAAMAEVGAVLRLIDSRLTGEREATRDELLTWTSGAALAIFGMAPPPDEDNRP
ncbi:hypothetical protein [Streptomyces parvus]|uniref:hypothetical protein n=1 Tax=Streptomyces parvus TaxID=66428 RepID=UPI003D72F251